MRQHSQARVKAYVRLLERCSAPETVIDSFLDLVEIDNAIATEPDHSLESLDRLLLDTCRRFDFAAPFDKSGKKAYLRPMEINHDLDGHASDTPAWFHDFDPKIEQAYRRGFDQGFHEARSLAEQGASSDLKKRQAQLHLWRRSPVMFGSTSPGTAERWGLRVAVRSGLPAKLRWQVLQRDDQKCVVCGVSALDGATLHVDHVVSIFNGGSDELSNLQTLCEPCNLGKGCS
jgi:hypothetical protein